MTLDVVNHRVTLAPGTYLVDGTGLNYRGDTFAVRLAEAGRRDSTHVLRSSLRHLSLSVATVAPPP